MKGEQEEEEPLDGSSPNWLWEGLLKEELIGVGEAISRPHLSSLYYRLKEFHLIFWINIKSFFSSCCFHLLLVFYNLSEAFCAACRSRNSYYTNRRNVPSPADFIRLFTYKQNRLYSPLYTPSPLFICVHGASLFFSLEMKAVKLKPHVSL